MKKSFISVLIFLLSAIFINAQDRTGGELNIFIKNNPNHDEIEIKLELIGSLCWDADADYTDVHNLTELFRGTTITISSEDKVEFLICWETTPSQYYRTFGLGFYKVTAYFPEIPPTPYMSDYFYIDYRTSDLPENFNNGGVGDINLDFDVSRGKFYKSGTLIDIPVNNTIWGLKPWISNIKDKLEPLPPENFQLSSGSSIHLSWNHSSSIEDYVTNYAVYRSVVWGCSSPSGNFTKIATLSFSATSYTDYNYSGNGQMTAYYKIVAVNGTRESDFTPTLNVCVSPGLDKKAVNEQNNLTFSLKQNFPNPFNPSTTINFIIEENSFVSLKIYDILGREAVVLVNEYKSAGEYNVEFNSEGLESGIYFYEIKAGNFSDIKKLILIK